MSLPLALILEDDPKLAELYETVLKQCKYEAKIIDSGREAQKSLEILSPALILLDIHLPYVSGMEILKQLQSEKRFESIPVIVMTADLYTAKDLKGKAKYVLLKTHGVTKLREIATSVHPNQ
jgi:DNA-binding response OmpR family regulator